MDSIGCAWALIDVHLDNGSTPVVICVQMIEYACSNLRSTLWSYDTGKANMCMYIKLRS